MVHWIYVLECEDDYLYVGETTRLFTRFNEHLKSRGGSNTSTHKPKKLIGLYKVSDNHSFMNYRNEIQSGQYNIFFSDNWNSDGDNLLIENHITQRFLYERRENNYYGGGEEWYKVRGGKYTRKTLDEIVAGYKLASEQDGRIFEAGNPINFIPVNSIVDRPLCKCGYPSEVKLSNDKKTIYFVCCLKNVWEKFCSYIEIGTPCDFWKPYTEDREIKLQYEIIKARSKESWVLNVPLSKYKISPEPCVSCNKTDYLAIFNGKVIRLCQPCMFNKYDSLKEKYENMCLIAD